MPTPANFDLVPAQSSTIEGQVLSPASSSTSSFSSVPSSIDNFQLSAEVRQSLNRPAPGASNIRPSLSKAPDPAAAPQKFIPQFGPAHRMPPDSDDEGGNISDGKAQAVIEISDQPQTFDERLTQAQEQSQVWSYIKDKLDYANFTCKTEREQGALLEILQLPKQNDLDDKPMRAMDKHQRRFNVIMGSILQVVGVKGYCNACRSHGRKNWEHRRKTCIGLPPTATGPNYTDLVSFVAGRCSNCIRSTYLSSSCHFAAGEAPTNAEGEEVLGATSNYHDDPGHATDKGVSDAAVGSLLRPDLASQARARPQAARQPTQEPLFQTPANGTDTGDRPPSPGSKPQPAHTPTAPDNASDDAEAIICDAITVGFRASTQLRPEEQRAFQGWVTALFSFSSSSPDLESQALAALAHLRRLPPGAQADIRRRVLQMLPGAMGRPA